MQHFPLKCHTYANTSYPHVQFIDSGRAACKSLLAIIDRKPEIDTRKSGKTLQNVRTLHFMHLVVLHCDGAPNIGTLIDAVEWRH